MNVAALIRRKRDGEKLTPDEITALIDAYTRGDVPDYQAAAFLMAVYFRGLDGAELAALTSAMLHSGDVVDLSDLPGIKIDKHSTGGVGDKISLPLAPAVAACGVSVPMISGRGLGHTGGTLDKLESIPGFRVDLSIDRFREILRACGLALAGQTERLAPADRKLYALRDVTGTVESIPLIAASIMSKKLAEGADGFVFDVKVGRGAFMKTTERARELGHTLVDIARRANKSATAFLTRMEEPLGRWVGNASEARESLAVLDGKGQPDLVELTCALGGEMLRLGGRVDSLDAGKARIFAALSDGTARQKFEECVKLQGGRLPSADEPWLSAATAELAFDAADEAYVESIDAEEIGLCGIEIGAGRKRKEDAIDPSTWIHLNRKVGERVLRGETFVSFSPPTASAGRDTITAEVAERLRAAYRFTKTPPAAESLIIEVIS